jgi:hypothetical protein
LTAGSYYDPCIVRFKGPSLLAATTILWVCFTPLAAHHSISAEFDLEKHVTVSGVVTRVEWMNPHTYFYLDAANPKTHRIEKWAFQLHNVKTLGILGWNRESLKVGDVVVASGSPTLSGSRAVYTRDLRFQDGRKLKTDFPPAVSAPQ